MSSETIIVYVDPAQVIAQKNNKYSLYLAKKVNGAFTVIWQSKGPIAAVGAPSYEYKNNFQIAVPAYEVNYGNLTKKSGSVSFTSGGKAVTINLGQEVNLSKDGTFGSADNGGTAGSVIVNNALEGNPHESLSDNKGNPLFVNVASGMDVGKATLTPIDEYQIWFNNYQKTGTIIADNVSNAKVVTFDSSIRTKTITYNKSGVWEDGAPASAWANQELDSAVLGSDEFSYEFMVAATFTSALSITAVTYLLSKLMDKFPNDIRPSKITTAYGSSKLEVKFRDDSHPGVYSEAVNIALEAAKRDDHSGLSHEAWSLSESDIAAYPV